jgi:K+-transporting ATPase KdpF subunit
VRVYVPARENAIAKAAAAFMPRLRARAALRMETLRPFRQNRRLARRAAPWLTPSISPSDSHSSPSWGSTPTPATGCEEAHMIEPLIGLVVSALLAVYLVYTLIRPERF